MLERSDYLLPLAAGQRQFRRDNYQMASAAQLEDLFFDAFGMFLRENHPSDRLARRRGKEVWDYEFNGLQMSHKESMSGDIAVWWTAGTKLPGGEWVPQPDKTHYSSPCPIVLVYSGRDPVRWSVLDSSPATLIEEPVMTQGAFSGSLGAYSLTKTGPRAPSVPLFLADYLGNGAFRVENSWTAGEWSKMGFHDFWPIMGGEGLGNRDLWLTTRNSSLPPNDSTLSLAPDSILPGIYVLTTDLLQALPLVANNRAHSIESSAVAGVMRQAIALGSFLPFPLWFAHLAVAAPPDLYVRQRAQYEGLFTARVHD